jgi:hypothetical protein
MTLRINHLPLSTRFYCNDELQFHFLVIIFKLQLLFFLLAAKVHYFQEMENGRKFVLRETMSGACSCSRCNANSDIIKWAVNVETKIERNSLQTINSIHGYFCFIFGYCS